MVEWQSDEPVTLEIEGERHISSHLRTLYEGPNQAVFVSGLPSGEYSLRLRDQSGATAKPLKLVVEHQSFSRAMLLVLLGALAFLAAVAVILRGADDA